jgi:hypothetical protein
MSRALCLLMLSAGLVVAAPGTPSVEAGVEGKTYLLLRTDIGGTPATFQRYSVLTFNSGSELSIVSYTDYAPEGFEITGEWSEFDLSVLSFWSGTYADPELPISGLQIGPFLIGRFTNPNFAEYPLLAFELSDVE